VIEYKGYTGVFEFDESIGAFHGHVLGIKDTVTFVGSSVEELKLALADSVEDYLELCAENGEEPDRPYRGDFVVRASPELHRAVAARAAASGMSMNAWIVSELETAVTKKRPVARRLSARKKVKRTSSAS
jgi:predicted HicB family RNase H-like nuclease